MTICVFRKYEKNMETLKHGNMLENLIIKDYSENSNSYRVLFSSVPVWTVWDGVGAVWDGAGRCGTVWDGMGRYGTVWDGMGRWRTGTQEKGTR